MTSSGNQHCASCIGTLLFPMSMIADLAWCAMLLQLDVVGLYDDEDHPMTIEPRPQITHTENMVELGPVFLRYASLKATYTPTHRHADRNSSHPSWGRSNLNH